MRKFLTALAALLPLLAEAAAKIVVWPRPFWVHFYDPEVIYFYQGLRLLRGVLPTNVDHPGTPLQLLTAGVAALTGPSLLDFGRFVPVAHLLLLAMNVCATLLLLATVLRDAPPLLQVAGVWTYWLAPQTLERTDVWTAEGTYFALGATVLALLWRWLAAPSLPRAIALGVVLGICVATKLLLLAWCGGAFAAMVVMRRYRDSVLLCFAIGAGILLGTLPVAPKWGFMLGRLGILSSLDPQEQGFASVFLNAKGWLLWLAIVTALAVWRRAPLPVVAFSVVAIALNIVAVRSNASFAYLLPAVMAVVALFAASVRGAFRRPVQLAVLTMCALLLAKSVRDDLGVHRRRIADADAFRAGVARLVPPGAVVVYGWRFPSESYALRVMTDDPRDHALVSTRYPREGHYTPWSRRIYLPPGVSRWDYLVVQREHLHGLPGTVVGEVGPYVVVRQ